MSERTAGRAAAFAAAAVAALTGAIAVASGPAAAQRTAQDDASRGRALAKRVVAAQSTRGFLMRARVVVGDESPDGSRRTVLQIRLLGRREQSSDRLLFQVLWPAALKGHALVVERRDRPPLSGFLFDPPSRVTPLTAALIARPFAGTGLTVEDLADDFWRWPGQRFAGRGVDGKQSCTLLESEPPADAYSAYALVRSCVDERRNVPRWVDKVSLDGAVVKRISFVRASSGAGSGSTRLTMRVEGPLVPPTRVEFLRQDRDVGISPDEFSVEGLARLGTEAPSRPPMGS